MSEADTDDRAIDGLTPIDVLSDQRRGEGDRRDLAKPVSVPGSM